MDAATALKALESIKAGLKSRRYLKPAEKAAEEEPKKGSALVLIGHDGEEEGTPEEEAHESPEEESDEDKDELLEKLVEAMGSRR